MGAALRRPALGLAITALGLAAAVLPGRAQAEEWLRADSDHMVVFSNAGRTAIQDFTRKLETYDAFLRVLMGVEPDTHGSKLRVYLLANDGDLKALWPEGVNIAGFYSNFGDEPMLVSQYLRIRHATAKGDTTSDADDTPFHEYTHYFQNAYAPASLPGWVVEGYAQYLQTLRIDPDAVTLGHTAPTLIWRAKASWMPWDELLRGTTGKIARDNWAAFYGQAWLLTHYMMSDPKRAVAFNRYLAAVAKGGDQVTALTDALGVDLPTLSRDLQTYYRSPLSVQKIQWRLPSPPSFTVTPLTAAEAALILPDGRTRYFVADKDKAGFVDKVRGIAARYGSDRTALLAAARVDAKYGDAARVDATVAPLIAANPEDADALLLRGRAKLRRAEAEKDTAARDALYRAAQTDLDTAQRAAPNDPAVLRYAAIARKTEAGYPSRRVIANLGAALDLQPQSQAIRLDLAEALLKVNRRPEALLVLQPILNNPHDEDGRKSAEKLLAAPTK